MRRCSCRCRRRSREPTERPTSADLRPTPPQSRARRIANCRNHRQFGRSRCEVELAWQNARRCCQTNDAPAAVLRQSPNAFINSLCARTIDRRFSSRVFLGAARFANLLFPSRATRCSATLAQLVEQLIRNQQVAGSNPAGGSSGIAIRQAGLCELDRVTPFAGE